MHIRRDRSQAPTRSARLVAERACDVAASRVILRYAPIDVTPLQRHLHPVMRMARLVLVSRFLAGHRRAAPLDRRALPYYEALACMRGLVRVAEQRTRSARDGTALTPLDASRFAERLAQCFARLTPVLPVLPRVPAARSDSVIPPHLKPRILVVLRLVLLDGR